MRKLLGVFTSSVAEPESPECHVHPKPEVGRSHQETVVSLGIPPDEKQGEHRAGYKAQAPVQPRG